MACLPPGAKDSRIPGTNLHRNSFDSHIARILSYLNNRQKRDMISAIVAQQTATPWPNPTPLSPLTTPHQLIFHHPIINPSTFANRPTHTLPILHRTDKSLRMNTRKRTKTAVADTACVVDHSKGCTSTSTTISDVDSWRRIFATFLTEASSALDHPFFYLVQSNGWKSLCQLTGLRTDIYSALLIKCKLVKITIATDGSKLIQVEPEQWKTFLESHGLRWGVDGEGGCAEITSGKINQLAVRKMAGERIDRTASDTKRSMWVLRVGVIPKGERAPKCTAINNNEEEPPSMNNSMWKAKTKIAKELKYLGMTMMMNVDDYNNVISVENWVLMKQVRTAGTKRKHCNFGMEPFLLFIPLIHLPNIAIQLRKGSTKPCFRCG